MPITLGLGDPASLLPQAGEALTAGGTGIGFMPHFESAAHGAWQAAALAAGVQLIDPRDDPRAVIAAIRSCRVVLSEALHGVIVADALRVPWVAIEPLAPIHRPKWHDWAETLDLRIAFRRLTASSLLEHARSSRMADYHAGRRLLVRHAGRLQGLGSERFLARAVGSLVAAAGAEPQLSDPVALDRSQSRMMERLVALRQDEAHPYVQPRRGVGAGTRPADLRACDESAYQPGLTG